MSPNFECPISGEDTMCDEAYRYAQHKVDELRDEILQYVFDELNHIRKQPLPVRAKRIDEFLGGLGIKFDRNRLNEGE